MWDDKLMIEGDTVIPLDRSMKQQTVSILGFYRGFDRMSSAN